MVGGIAINAVFLFSFGSAWFRRGAPFVPTAQRKIDAIFGRGGLLRALPQRRQRKHMVELGSGGGALVRAAVRQGGYSKATGYEINGVLVGYSWIRSCFSDGEHFRLQSLWAADVSDADLVFVYGVPSILSSLQAKLNDELPAGAHVVSNAFPFPTGAKGDDKKTWVEVERQWVEAGLSQGTLDDSSQVFLYRIEDVQATQTGSERADAQARSDPGYTYTATTNQAPGAERFR